MALTMENKFARIQLDKLPADLRKEAEMIRDDTENFSDPELVEIFEDNFKELYEIIEKKAPSALQTGKKLKKVPVAKRKVPAPKPVKKPEPKVPAKPPKLAADIEECKKILAEADFDITKRLVKGKRRITKKKRPEKNIIKDNAKRLVGTTKEDIKPTYPRADLWKKKVDEVGIIYGKLTQKIDHIVHQDRDMVKLNKIISLMKELIDPDLPF